jgi:hypothetical protein
MLDIKKYRCKAAALFDTVESAAELQCFRAKVVAEKEMEGGTYMRDRVKIHEHKS